MFNTIILSLHRSFTVSLLSLDSCFLVPDSSILVLNTFYFLLFTFAFVFYPLSFILYLLFISLPYNTSYIPAAPCPVPTHMETIPYLFFLLFISLKSCTESFAPVQPSGWPKRDCTTIDIDDLLVQTEFLNYCQGL